MHLLGFNINLLAHAKPVRERVIFRADIHVQRQHYL